MQLFFFSLRREKAEKFLIITDSGEPCEHALTITENRRGGTEKHREAQSMGLCGPLRLSVVFKCPKKITSQKFSNDVLWFLSVQKKITSQKFSNDADSNGFCGCR